MHRVCNVEHNSQLSCLWCGKSIYQFFTRWVLCQVSAVLAMKIQPVGFSWCMGRKQGKVNNLQAGPNTTTKPFLTSLTTPKLFN